MEIRYFKHYSHHLNRDMEFKVYGHTGKPVMFIPCQGGRFFDFENNTVKIGGIETYTLDLSLLLVKMGYEATVYTAINKNSDFNECTYRGFRIKEISKGILCSLTACFADKVKNVVISIPRFETNSCS